MGQLENPKNRDQSALKRLRLHFFTGLVVLAPMVVTVYVFWKLFHAIDGLLRGWLTKWGLFELIGRQIPGIGFVVLILLIIFIGMLTRNLVGRKMFELSDTVIARIPMVNKIYMTVQQISQALFARKTVFRKAVLIEFPRKGVYAIGFLTSVSKGEVQDRTEQEVYNVFLPTVPNPTSGFLLLVPKADITPLDMSIEEAVKLVISGGVVSPDRFISSKGSGHPLEGDMVKSEDLVPDMDFSSRDNPENTV